MDSALSPREIQSRIRSGATVEEVAVEAGVGVDQVEPFAVPVLAELDHIIEVAMTCPVRRAGAPGSHRTLGTVISRVARANSIPEATISWRSWRHEDRTWALEARWPASTEDAPHSATFRFDLKGRHTSPRMPVRGGSSTIAPRRLPNPYLKGLQTLTRNQPSISTTSWRSCGPSVTVKARPLILRQSPE